MATAARHEEPHQRAKRMLNESGYHKDEAQDEGLIKNMVKKDALKRKSGGDIGGTEPESRPDRRARGGALKHGGKIGAVNVVVNHGNPAAEQMAKQEGAQQGLQAGVKIGAQHAMAAAPHPSMAPPPSAMAGPPGGAPAMGPRPMPPSGAPMMAARGGAMVKSKDDEEC